MRADVHYSRPSPFSRLTSHSDGKLKYIQKRNYIVMILSCALLAFLTFKHYYDLFTVNKPSPNSSAFDMAAMSTTPVLHGTPSDQNFKNENIDRLIECFKSFNSLRSIIQGKEIRHQANKEYFVGDANISSRLLRKLYFTPKSAMTPDWMTREIFKFIHASKKMRVLITGGAGFIGSHLVDRMMLLGYHVLVLDNLSTGRQENICYWMSHPNFKFYYGDVSDVTTLKFLQTDLALGNAECQLGMIFHLACPASPPKYQLRPVDTVKTAIVGTMNILELARDFPGIQVILASTSEVYGDPQEHPQRESYLGHVSTLGPRSSYDEGKRAAETLAWSFAHQYNIKVKIARIFNTFGPRMNPTDGRLLSEFIHSLFTRNNTSIVNNDGLTIFGDGQQTRTLIYVHDLVDGLLSLAAKDYDEEKDPSGSLIDFPVVNLGGLIELTVHQIAQLCIDFFRSYYHKIPGKDMIEIRFKKARKNDPMQRRPCLIRAKEWLGWQPSIHLLVGLYEMMESYRLTENEK